MDFFQIAEDKIYEVVRKGLNILGHEDKEVFFSYYGIPEPKSSYCAIAILSLDQFGASDIASRLNRDEEMETTTHFEAYIQLSFIGEDSNSMATSFDWSLRADQRVLDLLGYNRVGLLNKSNIRRSPSLVDGKWVNGWNLDLKITFATKVTYTFDWVEFINLNGEVVKLPYKNN